ncbi:hypothetical protein ALC57_18666 [Trachymyrmex cornetzi]|uniref:Uncharacterized protein n=1 Tax=Trachymyrmex cornetzi TaxID=471704 RepID=A0A195D8P7_9HYME|nr:hypothetical protein ALC57_18666 [Trachymyrmex cornetzi]
MFSIQLLKFSSSNGIVSTGYTVNIPCRLRISFLIFGSAVEHWSDAYSCPSSSTGLVGAMLDKRIDGFTARSLALRSCYSISPKVHCSTSERCFYCTQRMWPPSSTVDVHSLLYESKRKGIFSVPITSSMLVSLLWSNEKVTSAVATTSGIIPNSLLCIFDVGYIHDVTCA